jgi:hypothetical protein
MSRINSVLAIGDFLIDVPGASDVEPSFAQCAEPGLSWRVPRASPFASAAHTPCYVL